MSGGTGPMTTSMLAILLIATAAGCDGRSGAPAPRSTPLAPGGVTIVSLDGSRSRAAAPADTSKERRGPVEDGAGATQGEAARPAPAAESTFQEAVSTSAPSGSTVDVSRDDPAPYDGREPGPVLEAEHAWSASMAKLVRDLEFNQGLPEPPQQTVVPPRAPWTAPPEASVNPAPSIEAVFPCAGRSSGGEPVTIRGQHLDPMLVTFGLAPATIVERAQDLLVVAAPPGAPGEAPIVVTNRDGNYAIAAAGYRYAP